VTHPPGATDPGGPVVHRAVAVAVLAGGGSRRMGRDKAAVVVEGRTLLERTLAAAGSLASPPTATSVIGRPGSPTSAALGRWVPDLRPGQGPLAGLETALTLADDVDAILVVGVDHPWLAPPVLATLVDTLLAAPDHLEAVVLGTADGPLALLGAYRPSARRVVSTLLDAGERRLHTLLDRLRHEVLTPDRWRHLDPLGATAVDVDDADELAAAVRWHARASATPSGADRADDAGGAG
jgi:molybdenum cofactor guanylyltransferase